MAESVALRQGSSELSLSIKPEDLQTLINEVRTLREQNAQICQYLAVQNHIFRDTLSALDQKLQALDKKIPSESLAAYIVRVARMSTADFVIKNMNTVKAFSNVRDIRQYAVEQTEVDGIFLEFGVFKGTSINFMSSLKPDKIFYGFDSFKGLPEDWLSNRPKGSYSAEGILPKVNDNVRLIQGWFDETLPNFLKKHSEPCAFIHIDCDLYSSAKIVLKLLKKHIVKNTVILFDEYFNYPGWENNEYRAFSEFIEEQGLKFEYLGYINTHLGEVAVKIK